ncbi:MAG: hypothetical protein CMB80_03790 [Flammeovirgaceae bacterium]|nr:hypothetical protein [Flammeovirgaceae bacterium]
MKITMQCIENIPEHTLVKYNNSDILVPFDGIGIIVGVSNKPRMAELSEGVTVNVCELIVKDVALCTLTSSFSRRGGVAYADNGSINSTGSYEVGYVFPRSFQDTSDYQIDDKVWVHLK